MGKVAGKTAWRDSRSSVEFVVSIRNPCEAVKKAVRYTNLHFVREVKEKDVHLSVII